MPSEPPPPKPGLAAALLVAVTLAATCPAGATPAAAAPPAFKIYLERPGVYRVGYEDLAAAGLGSAPASRGLGLEAAGEPVPIWVEDGGDGRFGPGDWLEFAGRELRGEVSYRSEYTRFNVYFLHLDSPQPRRMIPARAAVPPTAKPAEIRRRQHLEEDLLILRLPPARRGEREEIWYWARLAHNQRQPFAATLDLGDLDPAAAGPVELRIHLRGWSKPRTKPDPELADHRVQVSLNGEELAAGEWNGTRPYLLEVPPLAAGRLVRGDNTLELRVPKRADGGADGEHLIDVVMLNWVEVSYPRQAGVDGLASFAVAAPAEGAEPAPVLLAGAAGQALVLYGERGSRTVRPAAAGKPAGERLAASFRPPPGERAFFAARPADLLAPEAVVRDRPSALADAGNRADYVIVAHRTLLPAIEPLAELHRGRGLEVLTVDVEDVYDEFSHGVVHPAALKDFLDRAYHGWQRPAPRWVLLVGDASWDGRNRQAVDANYADWTYRPGETRRFAKNQSTAYPQDAERNHRGLIPTWSTTTGEGHSASDNYFVAFDDDPLPRMAIGRLPVVEPEEVARIVDKTVRYVKAPEVGPWRRNALFITNESRGFQRQSDRLAGELSAAGFAPHKVYPASTETSNEHHTRRLIETFDQGQLFVHFLGHGGRYIWRTGPPDLKKNHDLFTLEHLDQLAATGRLPVVLSLTCYSAPFDHPSADSIGEKLLRLGGRGAIAVLAASWRNSPSPHWGEALLAELTAPGATVGEAVMRAKQRIKNRMFVETYNLLGDPAVPVALPAAAIELHAGDEAAGGRFSVRGVVGVDGFAGRVVVDLVGAAGEALRSEELAIATPEFAVELAVTAEELAAARGVRAYAWNAERGIDAVGALELERQEDEGEEGRWSGR